MNLILTFLWKNKFIVGSLILIGGLYFYNIKLQQELSDTQTALASTSNNMKAYQAGLVKWEDRYGQEHAKTIMFNENLSAFKTSSDSITKKLISIIKDQGISLDKLKSASIIQTKVTTSLTKEIQTMLPDTSIDLSNKDIKNIIRLSPYRVSSDIEFYNTQAIIATDSIYKVYTPYRYKFFLKRWLQHKEKETLVNMEVINSNPLMKTQQQKFIHIIKEK